MKFNSKINCTTQDGTLEKFKIGDIVQLKSGGPAMTISEDLSDPDFNEEDSIAFYECTWFDDHSCLKRKNFSGGCLQKMQDAKDPWSEEL